MGCSNSDALPEPQTDIRNTISKIAPDKQATSQKKIAKSVTNFQQLTDELRLMLKQDEFYDYLFRADYFQEMLDFMRQSYVNHQESMKIVSIILEYMSLTKNFLNGRHTLKTNFKVDTLASQLSKRWTQIRAQVFYVNKNALKILNYLAYDLDQSKCWFSSSYLTLKFDFNQDQAEAVAKNTLQLCKYDKRAFFYFSNYLVKACKTEYDRVQTVTIVEARLTKIIQDVSQHLAQPLPLNGQDELFQLHRNFNSNFPDNPAFLLDLEKVKPNERIKALQTFIVNKAKSSIECFNKFNHLFQPICHQHQCSHYKSEVRLKSRSQKAQILKIKQQFLDYHHHKQVLPATNGIMNVTPQEIMQNQYQIHRKQVDFYCQTYSGTIKFKIYDMLRSQCTFNSLTKLNQCCSEILKQITKKGYKLIELSNKLRVAHEIPHIILRILIDNTLCEFKFVFQYNLGQFYFFHLLNKMTKSKYFSLLTRILLFNEQISNSFLLQAKEIIEANNNGKIQYGQRLNFSQVKGFFKELRRLLAFTIDYQRKAHNSLDFNLIFQQIDSYKTIAEDFINGQVKIDSSDKIRTIAQYLFYQKKFQLSEVLFSHYEKEIVTNHTYLIDKIKHNSKEYIKSQMELIEFYAESIHYLAKIYKQKKSYSQSLEYYNKYLPLHTIVHKQASDKVVILKNMAQLNKLQKNYDQAINKYELCIEIQGKQHISNVQMNHQIVCIYRKQAKWKEALKYQTENLQIIQKDKGKDCLQYARCLRNISDIFKQSKDHSQCQSRLEESKQIYQKFQSKYTKNYSQIVRQLGFLEQKLENYNKALLYYQQSIEILSRLPGQYYGDCQKIYLRIGHIYLQIGNHKQAINKLNPCLDLTKKIFGSQSIQVSNVLGNMGSAHQHLSEYEEALSCFLKCSSIKKHKLGSTNIDYIRTMVNIGVLYDESGKTQKALQTYKECLSLLADSNQDNNGDEAILLNNMGLIEHDRGQYAKALQKFDKALQIQEKVYGNSNKQYANTLINIGLVKDDMCRYSQALMQYKKCLTIYQQLKHCKSQVAATYDNIGTTLLHLYDFKQAMKYYQKCLLLEQSCNGKESKSYSMCIYCIGLVKYQQDHLNQAEKYFEQSKAVLKKLRCLNTIDYSQILVSFGKICHKRNQIDQSLVHFDEAITIIEATNQPNPSLMIEILLNKGISFFRLKQFTDSMDILRKAYHLCQKYNLKYREYASINYNIGLIQMQDEKYIKAIKYFQVAMNLQQQFHDRHWKITAGKLAACSFRTQNHQKYKIYVSYAQSDDVIARNQHRMNDKFDMHTQ